MDRWSQIHTPRAEEEKDHNAIQRREHMEIVSVSGKAGVKAFTTKKEVERVSTIQVVVE